VPVATNSGGSVARLMTYISGGLGLHRHKSNDTTIMIRIPIDLLTLARSNVDSLLVSRSRDVLILPRHLQAPRDANASIVTGHA
jgi:hypothetical protein